MIVHLGTQIGNDGALSVLAYIEAGEVKERRQVSMQYSCRSLDDVRNISIKLKNHYDAVREAIENWQIELEES